MHEMFGFPYISKYTLSTFACITLCAITQPPNLSDQRDYASDLRSPKVAEEALKHSAQCAPPFGFD